MFVYVKNTEEEFQESFVKPNLNFGMCANDVDNTDTILNSNPRGLGCNFKGTLDTTQLASRKTGKKVENISKCFFEKSFYFNEVLDIPVIKGHLSLNISKRDSHNSC